MEGIVGGWMNCRWTGAKMDGWMDGWLVGKCTWINGSMDGWMDGRNGRWIEDKVEWIVGRRINGWFTKIVGV